MPKARVQREATKHDPKKSKKGCEDDKGSGGHAKLTASPPQQPTNLLQAKEDHAELASKEVCTGPGENSLY